MQSYFEQLGANLREYRTALEKIGSRKFTRSRDCQHYYFNLLLTTSKLYCDWLTMRKMEKAWGDYDEPSLPLSDSSVARREAAMREKLTEKLKAMPWASFEASNFFPEDNLLRSRQDYLHAIEFHLPEIYGEAIRLQPVVEAVLSEDRVSRQKVAVFIVGLAHAAHHESYCRYALEILSDELSWK